MSEEEKELVKVREGSAEIYVYLVDKDSIPSKSMNVFYNNTMEINRDISNLAIISYKKLYNPYELNIIDAMAASGISSIRMLMECENIKKIYINDINPIAIDLIYKNLELNPLNQDSIEIQISNKDANLLFLEVAQQKEINSNVVEGRPNVISIDPFGTPNKYIDSAFKTIAKTKGLLCITATDTAVLFGIKPAACVRKYMSKPLHTEYCKEIGARILLYFISRIANVNRLGILPLLTFYSNHFIRIFILTFKNKKKITESFSKYGFIIHCKNCGFRSAISIDPQKMIQLCPFCEENGKIEYAGPLWIGNIHDKLFVEDILLQNNYKNYRNKKRIFNLINLILDEIGMPLSYYNIHKLSQELKISNIPKIEKVLNIIKEKGFKASRTHFDFVSIKTDLNIKALKSNLLNMNN